MRGGRRMNRYCSRSDCKKKLTKLEQKHNFRTAFPLCRRCHLAQDLEVKIMEGEKMKNLEYIWRALDAKEEAEGAEE